MSLIVGTCGPGVCSGAATAVTKLSRKLRTVVTSGLSDLAQSMAVPFYLKHLWRMITMYCNIAAVLLLITVSVVVVVSCPKNSSEGVTPIDTQQTENFADNEINTDSPSESIVPITMAESVHQQRSSVSNGENENGGTDKNKTAESQNIAQCFAGLQETFKLLINRDNTHDKSREFYLQQWYDHAGIGNRSETALLSGNYQGQGTENASFHLRNTNWKFFHGTITYQRKIQYKQQTIKIKISTTSHQISKLIYPKNIYKESEHNANMEQITLKHIQDHF
ncbi:unnamed protein product [Mytilus coruscus]|uniref:Uncharacterized protein n=1 Tax=Mytilus coruscus TaxID=42192 RepID=A0A6J8DEL3_MYTCO|nr:unnamed protein product [Mytilus coruscus]